MIRSLFLKSFLLLRALSLASRAGLQCSFHSRSLTSRTFQGYLPHLLLEELLVFLLIERHNLWILLYLNDVVLAGDGVARVREAKFGFFWADSHAFGAVSHFLV